MIPSRHLVAFTFWFSVLGSLVKVFGCLYLVPGSLDLVPSLPGEVSGLSGFTSWFHGCLNSLPGCLDVIPWLPHQGSWLRGLGSMIPSRLLVAWINFLVLFPWFTGSPVKVSGCLYLVPGSLDLLPGEVLWSPEFTSCLQMVKITGCFDLLRFSGLGTEKVPGCLAHFLVASICFHGCKMKVSGCLGSLLGSLDFVPWLPGFNSWFHTHASMVA